ncbi:MAG TPA: hypothetical protein VMZ91_03540 [Candidatus Paceibacterota bacterium]|nr:hypothetical protein [Candidatus Paceibacterota bacterium]
MKSLIRRILKEESDKQTDLANTQSNDYNICDDFSPESYEDLVNLINKAHVSKEDYPKIKDLLGQLKKDNDKLSNDLDNLNTYAHKISSVLCK